MLKGVQTYFTGNGAAMNFIFQPWQILFVAFCGLVNQRQTEIIDFQNAQITALLQRLGKKRIT